MAWFRKEKKPKEAVEKVAIPEGLWVKCDDCKEIVYRKEVEQNLNVCPKCGYHFRLRARERFEILFDDGKYNEFAGDIRSADPLEFRDTKRYRDRLKSTRPVSERATRCCAPGKLDGISVVICAMEYAFMGGSMGSVVGEELPSPRSARRKEPLLIVSTSGAPYEGILSLMQMAKISLLARLAFADFRASRYLPTHHRRRHGVVRDAG
jgi:acetyl-CoA carboxylase carboxyl transferase subunit beta